MVSSIKVAGIVVIATASVHVGIGRILEVNIRRRVH